MKISNVNIAVDRKKCIACGVCVDRCIMDNLRLALAPCRQACPLQINCQGYIRLLAQGDGTLAAEELRKHTPFAEVLGRVCSAPCMDACRRKARDGTGAVRIRAITRHLSAQYPDIIHADLPCSAPTGKTVAIAGTGPAALQATYELLMLGHQVTLYEAAGEPGGQLRHEGLPEDVVAAALGQVTRIGAKIVLNQAVADAHALAVLRSQHDAVILAVGVDGGLRASMNLVQGQGVDAETGAVQCMDAVFAAGSCLLGAIPIVQAMASGKHIALCAHRKIMNMFPLVVDYATEAGFVCDQAGRDTAPGACCQESKACALENKEAETPLPCKEAKHEAGRCLSCGQAYEANKTCWYCLPCEIDCPRQALNVKMPYLVR